MTEIVTVLAIDDDPFNLDLILETFEEQPGFQVITVENAKEALELLKIAEEPIDVIILDWMMPEMSGLELLKELQQHPTYQAIPVVMQTAKVQPADRAASLRAGAFAYLTKPFDSDELITVVLSALKSTSTPKAP